MKTADHILEDLAGILSNFQGREYSGTIDRETRFIGDLGFSSIDVVILGETLETYYDKKLPFGAFLSELAKKKVQDVSLGDLADFLYQQTH